jgi:subtilase family serine protease
MSRTPLLALLVAVLTVASLCPKIDAQVLATVAQTNRVSDHAESSSTVPLAKTVPGWAIPARDAGALPDNTPISVQVVVARAPQVQTAFEQLLDAQQNPNSPRYHQWLTPERIGAEYGPTQHDLDALTGWLTAQGLTVTEVSPSRVLVRATASAGVVAKAFQTQFRQFTLNGKPQFSVTAEPSIPAALSPIVAAIAGLSQVELVPLSHVQPIAAPIRGGAAPEYTTGTNPPVYYVFPADFATIFDLNPLYSANIEGSGQHVAIIGESQISVSDITEFESLSNLPSNTPNIIIPANGVNPGTIVADEGESDLDLQRVIGVAPAVTADFVISGTLGSEQGIDVAINWEVNSLKDPVMTISYGACEADAGAANTNAWNALMSQAASEGITVFVSSGDAGAAGCETAFAAATPPQKLSINYLCASQYVTCVGGTEFNDTASPATYWSSGNGSGEESALSYIPEGAWNESTTTSVAASGGGASTVIVKPSFQTGTGVPADGFRDVPDVAFPAASHDGYFGCEADVTFSGGGTGNCANGGGIVFSGTSAAAPGWAGVAALLNEKLGGAGQGNLNPLIYRLASTANGSPFHDATPATSGVSPCLLTTPSLCNNSTPGSASLTGGLAGYALTTGYDQVTGWGSIDVYNFVNLAAGGVALSATTTTLTATATSITTSQTVIFSSTVSSTSGTPTGSVQFSSNGMALGAPVTLVNGVAASPAETFSTIGTYTISSVYSGSSAYADSAAPALTLNVTSTGKTASTTTLTATATTATPTATVGFTATVAGSGTTPTGTVQFKLNGTNLGSAVAISGGSASLPAQTLALGSDVVTAVYSGDSTFSASTSNSVTVTVTALTSATSIAESATTTNTAGYLVFSGTVTGVNGGPVPTGTLSLYSGGSPALNTPLALTSGSLAVAVSGVPVGTYAIYWVYSGDANYSPSQSSPINFTVSSSFVPTYTLAATNASVSAVAGAAASNTITLASANGYLSNVALSCSATYTGSSTDTIVEPSCTFSPAAINLGTDLANQSSNIHVNAAGVYETSTVTLATVVPHDIKRAGTTSSLLLEGLGGSAFAGLLLCAIPGVRRRRMWNALAAVLVLAALAGVGGCGGSSSPTGGGGGTPPLTGSPSGAYTITVIGTGGVTTTFTLNLQ